MLITYRLLLMLPNSFLKFVIILLLITFRQKKTEIQYLITFEGVFQSKIKVDLESNSIDMLSTIPFLTSVFSCSSMAYSLSSNQFKN